MANPVWDVGLPAISVAENWREIPAPRFIETQTDGGALKRRANPNPRPDQVTFSQILTLTQKQTLDTFYLTTLANGVLPFDTTHPTLGTTKAFQFAQRPEINHRSGNIYVIDYVLNVLP